MRRPRIGSSFQALRDPLLYQCPVGQFPRTGATAHGLLGGEQRSFQAGVPDDGNCRRDRPQRELTWELTWELTRTWVLVAHMVAMLVAALPSIRVMYPQGTEPPNCARTHTRT